MKLNRKISPNIHTTLNVDIPPIETIHLDNGIPVTIINLGSEDIIKFEIVHQSGRSVETKKLVSRATASLLKEGCGQQNAEQFADKFDHFGAGLRTAGNMDFIFSTLFTLGKHFGKVVPYLSEMYKTPRFLEDELENYKKVNIQKLKEELTKNDVLAYRHITEEIFGSTNPYGYNSFPHDYDNLTTEDLKTHFNQYIGSDNANIFVSGKISNTILEQINEYFGKTKIKTNIPPYLKVNKSTGYKRLNLSSPNDHQCSLKIGRKLFNRTHEDQSVFFVLNTILGGYFGSRLMSSIREKKGYTYDISSSMDQMLHDGFFYIGTDVSKKYLQETIVEIYNQIEMLKTDLVGDEELKMVKNYITGNFLTMIDGPLNLSNVVKTLKLTNIPFTEFGGWVKEIMAVTPENIRLTAQKYLNKEDMIEVILKPEK